MREILFRGKRIDNGEWVDGSLISWADGSCSIESGKLDTPMWCVIPETVGQYTGLTANGKKIFEGDVFEWGYAGVKEFRYVVAFDAEIASFVGNRGFGFVSLNGIDIEIIGNIYDNPELLEER